MKKIFILFCFLIYQIVLSQTSGNIAITWNLDNPYTIGDVDFNIPNFPVNMSYNSIENRIFYISKISTNNSLINENSLVITNLITESVNESSLGMLNKKVIPTTIEASIKNNIARDDFSAILQFNPIYYEDNTYKRVVSFSYSFNQALVNKSFSTQNIVNSVLKTGSWYRFYVQKSGVYKLDKAFIKSLGMDVDKIDPRKIQIYGNGGRMLPITNNEYYPNDLAENAIQVIGEDDGVFNNEDYILLYCEGLDNWSEDNLTHLNLYSDKSYYYITYSQNNGKRISTFTQPTGSPSYTFTNFDDYQFYEKDLTNIARLGKVFVGESFYLDNEQEFNFNFPQIDTTNPASVKVQVGDDSSVNTSFDISINGGSTPTLNLIHIAGANLTQYVEAASYNSVSASQNFNIKLKYNNNGVPSAKGYLNYIAITAKSNLVGYNKQYRFKTANAANISGIAQYNFSNSSSISQIWDVSDIWNVSAIATNNTPSFSFKTNLGISKQFIAVDPSDYYTPQKEQTTTISNQNLKGDIFYDKYGIFRDIDYLIVCPSFLNPQAEKLAEFHRNYNNYNVKVVALESIYQEFGGGKQDVAAIRNFVKYLYQNASSASSRVKFLNLFGDASFDYKNRIPNNTNIVPIFHAKSSFTEAASSSFATDDYYGMMDDSDPNPEMNLYGIDVAVGRMIVSTNQQADEMVTKVIEYHDIKSYGNWRNNYVAIADDPDAFKTADNQLQYYQNKNVDVLYQQKPFINYKKIFLDAYQQETTAGGTRYPKVNEDIQNAFEKGALVFNYLGHGGEEGLANERIWNKFDGYNFYNQYRYPLFITLTCDFSRFDNPYKQTSGEYTFWNPKGGAIAMVTTIRQIPQSGAQYFNEIFTSYLFSYGSTNYGSIAEALRKSKNDYTDGSTTRIVSLLGDPALALAIAKPNVVLTKVNDIPISQPIDDFKALSYVKITGEVRDETGSLLNNYNGELAVTIFDKDYTKNTLRNDNYDAMISPTATATYFPFTSLGEAIFRGNASVTNGSFEFGFVVPRDIKIPLGNGRISFYTKRNQTRLDKTGYNVNIKVGGINTNAPADTTPPKVRLYMNDETFLNGGNTNQSPYFLAFLDDEHGINTASGIGHDIVAVLDGNESNPYILNDYYETELNNYTKGKIRFPFRNLSVGLHTITFKAWDVYNNYVTSELQFVVVGDENVVLTNVLNYPNPFVNYTEFWFTHNKPYENLDVQVQIFTITGKVVKTINQSIITEGFLSRSITWDGLDDFGEKIGKGVYVYKLTVKSQTTGKKSEKIEKLVIL